MRLILLTIISLGFLNVVIADENIYGKGGFATGIEKVLSGNKKEIECNDSIDAYRIWENRHGFSRISYKDLLKLKIHKSVFISLSIVHSWNHKLDTVITGNCIANNQEIISAYRFYNLDSANSKGYLVSQIEFPANKMNKILSAPIKRDKVECGGGYGCIGKGFLILNDKYYVSVPCGYKYLKFSFPLFFVDKNVCEEMRFELPFEKVFIENIRASAITRKYKIYKRYIELLSFREHITIE